METYIPERDLLIYCKQKINGYHIIGNMETENGKICIGNREYKVSLSLVKFYAGKPDYFKSLKIPLKYEEYKEKEKYAVSPLQDASKIIDKKYDYIKESVKQKKQHFLLKIVPSLLIKSKGKNNKNKFKQIDLFRSVIFKRNKGKISDGESLGFLVTLDELWNDIIAEESQILMTKDDYIFDAICLPDEIVSRFSNRDKLTKEDLSYLNKITSGIPKRNNPLIDFAYSFFDSLLSFLENNRILTQCPVCNNVFIYKKNKLYCSLLSEGKDCGKKIRNKRDYIRHRRNRLLKSRKLMQELRAFYNARGIKK